MATGILAESDRSGAAIFGRTAIGRVTVRLLAMNGSPLLPLRKALIAEGLLPAPEDVAATAH